MHIHIYIYRNKHTRTCIVLHTEMLKIQIPHQVRCTVAGHGLKMSGLVRLSAWPISGSACEIPWSSTPLLLMWNSQCRCKENPSKDLDGRSFTEALRGMVSYDPYLLCRKLISVIRRTPCFGTSSDPLQDFGKNKVHCQIPSRGLAICTGHWWMPHSQGSRFSRWIKTACHAGGEWTAIDIHLPSFTSYLEVKYRVSFEYPYQFWMLFVLFSICNLPVWSWLCSEWGNCNPCRQRLWHTVPCGHRSVLCSVPVFGRHQGVSLVTQRNCIPIQHWVGIGKYILYSLTEERCSCWFQHIMHYLSVFLRLVYARDSGLILQTYPSGLHFVCVCQT